MTDEIKLVALQSAIDIFNNSGREIRESFQPMNHILSFATQIEAYLRDNSNCEQDAFGCNGDASTCVCGEKI